MCRMSAGIPKAAEKTENDATSVREMTNKWRKNYLRLRLSPDEHPSFPFSTNLIKINHLLPSHPISHLRAAQFPLWIIPSPCSYVRRLFFVISWSPRSSERASCDCLSGTSSSQSRCRCGCGPHVISEEKSLRTNPTLKFQQRRENTSTVTQFNVVLFFLSESYFI